MGNRRHVDIKATSTNIMHFSARQKSVYIENICESEWVIQDLCSRLHQRFSVYLILLLKMLGCWTLLGFPKWDVDHMKLWNLPLKGGGGGFAEGGNILQVLMLKGGFVAIAPCHREGKDILHSSSITLPPESLPKPCLGPSYGWRRPPTPELP